MKNHIISMNYTRWPRKLFVWDIMTNTESWHSDVCFILNYAGLNSNVERVTVTDLDNLSSILMDRNRNNWRLEASKKTKLETFEQIHDFSTTRTLLGQP